MNVSNVMPGVVYLNGEFMPRERATLSVDDRGFIFGDGIYEVTRVVNGRLFEADRTCAAAVRASRIGIDPRLTPEQIIDIHTA
jgi:D-alanine transaminase